MNKILIFLVILALFGCTLSRETTYSDEFIKKFQVRHITEGDRENFPFHGDNVTVHYTGSFPNSGEVFDSSHSRSEPLTFTLGHGYVIPCWDEVLEKMSKGEKIYFVCPHSLAYGEAGAGSIIPPNSDIAFEVELINFDTKQIEEEAPKPEAQKTEL